MLIPVTARSEAWVCRPALDADSTSIGSMDSPSLVNVVYCQVEVSVTTHPPDGIELLPFIRLSIALPTPQLSVKSLTLR